MEGSQTLYVPYSSPEQAREVLHALTARSQPAGALVLLRISPVCDSCDTRAQLYSEFRALRAVLEREGFGHTSIVLYRSGGGSPRQEMSTTLPSRGIRSD